MPRLIQGVNRLAGVGAGVLVEVWIPEARLTMSVWLFSGADAEERIQDRRQLRLRTNLP
jgi:hypothetical protein